MELVELHPQHKDSYNHFVMEQASGSFLQSWEWGEWQERLGRQVFRYNILCSTGHQIATIQFIKMPLPLAKFYLYAPYGPVISGQWAVETGQIIEQLKQKFPAAVFIRIEPKDLLLSTTHYPLLSKSLNIQPAKSLLIDLSKSEEQLLAEMHHKTRYNIKLAHKHAVEVKEEFGISVGHGLYFQEAIDLICQTASRQGFTTYSSNYYKNLVDFFALNSQSQVKAHVYKAIFQNQLLAAAIMIDLGKTRTFLFGGSSEFHKNVMAPYALHWQAITDAKAAGFGFYDFWGVETSSGDTPGFVKFKLGFGGEIKEYAGAYDIIQNKFFYKFYSLARWINKKLR